MLPSVHFTNKAWSPTVFLIEEKFIFHFSLFASTSATTSPSGLSIRTCTFAVAAQNFCQKILFFLSKIHFYILV